MPGLVPGIHVFQHARGQDVDGRIKSAHDGWCGDGRKNVIKIWGRNTSSNVQKVMWAVGEMGLPHERIDIGGGVGKNPQAAHLAMEPERPGRTRERKTASCSGNRIRSCVISPPSIKRRCSNLPICVLAPTPANGWTGNCPLPG